MEPLNKPVNINATPSVKTINTTAKTLKNTVKSATNVADALNAVSAQLSEVAVSLRKNAPAIANATAQVMKQTTNTINTPEVKQVVGGSNIQKLNNIRKETIANATKKSVLNVANGIQNISKNAKNASKVVNTALNVAGKGADFVAKNVSGINSETINKTVQNTNNVLNIGVNKLNNTVKARVSPNVNIKVNVNKAHLNAIKNGALNISGAIKRNNNTQKNISGVNGLWGSVVKFYKGF
jgi:DNA-binding ferritin-like protein